MRPLKTLPQLLEQNARERPDALALALPDGQVTHSELEATTRQAALFLRSIGVRAGDHVGVLLPAATLDYFAVSIGAMRLGAVAICLNARFKTRELEFALENTRCRVLFSTPPLLELIPGQSVSVELKDVADVRAHWVNAGTVQAHLSLQADPESPARIIYTSGTTSMPKACIHSLAAMAHQGAAVAERLALTERDRFWAPLPLFHTGGWTPFLAAQAVGASYHHPGHFDPTIAVRQISDDGCTVLFPGFETIWMRVLTHPEFEPSRLKSARLVINVGTPQRLRIMQELLPGVPQVSNTGCTEVGGFLSLGEASDSPSSRFTTAGRVLDGMEARIVDPVSGNDVPDGTPGELHARGPACLLGYFNDPEATREAVADGWFRTGDMVARETTGELRFVSRLKDMLKVGGENVAALEIEDHLLSHSAIRTVAVVSAPDEVYGEVPAAFVELWPSTEVSEAEVIDFCRGKIASYKVPRLVRFVSEWPMSGTKIRKLDLRNRIADELAKTDVPDEGVGL